MKIPLKTAGRKGALAALGIALATAYVVMAASQFAASWFGSRAELSSLKRAVWLDPGDAEYRHDLGRYYDLVGRDPASAVEHYKAAVQLDPHSARYWFDLASAYQVLGDTPHQADALERAIHADATTPDVAWEAANFYLVQGENEKALREFRVVIANDTSLVQSSLQACWRIEPDVDALLRDVVPARADTYTNFLILLESKQETAGAAKVWNALMQTHERFELQYGYDYIRYLVQHKEVDQAVMAWQQITSRFGLSAYQPSAGNLIVNGSFNLAVLNAGFDWQHQKQSGVTLILDDNDSHGGHRSLQITFDGPGIVDAGMYQLVAVEPNTTYDFTAYYKNGEMEGAGGPHFTIQDMYTQAVYYESEELNDAGFWKSANGEFKTAADCKLVVVHIRRLPSGSPMRGKLWVDDFHLVRKASEVTVH
ncbi:MAG TPA: carbohydrate binding domain-containing protein [Candidatus Dormibacteraeota bacterium]|nr:carbohydrate binding domain-containing protein [Candidatus Dormibacteraeota bacterium]